MAARDEGQGDAGVAAGRLDKSVLPGWILALALRRFDHGEADAVFDAVGRIAALQLATTRACAPGGDAVELDKGRVADQVGDAGGDFHGVLQLVR